MSHTTELRERVEYRINESYCTEEGCEYRGKPAVQGHCYHRLDDETDRYIERLGRRSEDSLAFYRRDHTAEDYVKVLESLYVCAMMNWEFAIDSLIRLRLENAALKSAVDGGKP